MDTVDYSPLNEEARRNKRGILMQFEANLLTTPAKMRTVEK